MSVQNRSSQQDSLSLEQLDGAVLTYEDENGEKVVVEFSN